MFGRGLRERERIARFNAIMKVVNRRLRFVGVT